MKLTTQTQREYIDAIKSINADAPHQQDQLNWMDGAARTLATATHGAASHLTKTVIVISNRNK